MQAQAQNIESDVAKRTSFDQIKRKADVQRSRMHLFVVGAQIDPPTSLVQVCDSKLDREAFPGRNHELEDEIVLL